MGLMRIDNEACIRFVIVRINVYQPYQLLSTD